MLLNILFNEDGLTIDRSTWFLPRDKLLQNLLGVFETLGNLGIASNKLVGEVVCFAIPLFIDIGDMALVRSQEHFSVIVEHNLHRLVTYAEEDCMLGSNPFLQVDKLSAASGSSRRTRFVCEREEYKILVFV
jgi:hypothetical protein